MDTKVGIYLCSGCGIKDTIDLEELKSTIDDDLNFVELAEDEMVCGDFEEKIRADVKEKELNRVIIGACSGRYFADKFNFGPDVMVDRVPLRELVAWSHDRKDFDEVMEENDWDGDEHPIHELAADYMRMSSARVENSEPPTPIDEEISKDILVVGGGVSGMSAALASAKAGYKVNLVEKDSELGGMTRHFKMVFPTEPPFEKPAEPPVAQLAAEVNGNENIKVFTSSTVAKTAGQPGQFDVTVKNGSGEESFRVGAIIQATGWTPYEPEKLADKYGYGNFQNVVTSLELEKMVSNGGVKRASDGKAPSSVAIVHCAGSRDKEHLAYCSAVCCRTALKQALYIREQLPETDVYLLYKDLRSPGVYEQFYEAVQQVEGIYLTKGEVVDVKENGNEIEVSLDDTLLGESMTISSEMLVLATGMKPTTRLEGELSDLEIDGIPDADCEKEEDSKEFPNSGTLNLQYMQGPDLPKLKYGFTDSHFICFPYETKRTGIYAAGTVRAPMDIAAARTDGYGAALKAIQVMEQADKGLAVHPRVGDASSPDFFLQRCTQCKRCTQECPFGTLDEDEKGTPKPNPMRCRRCGICMGACPERIISFSNYSPNMVSQMIKAIEIPDEDEEKRRILCFVCENDAMPALDIAAMHRKKLPATVRIIPVRCIGSINTIWIADSFSNGFDGVMLIGCQRGDDYQCHFVRGSELAQTRMKNVKEKLEQLVLEPERVRIESVEISDWQLAAGMINDFAEEIEELDQNPYKGF
jgi:quinone-modifying oxidoreductase, subunit QmoB